MQPLVIIDYSTSMILVGSVKEKEEEKLIAMGGFFRTKNPSKAELAFLVHKEWRNNGITSFLLEYLVQIARELDYRTFVGNFVIGNKAIAHIIKKSPFPTEFEKVESGVVEFSMDITLKSKT